MITFNQATELGKRFQINIETIYREYLQLTILDRIYQNKVSKMVCFKGGTALRLLFKSSRFSEDLDFDTILTKKEIELLMKETEQNLKREFPELEAKILYSGKNGMRFRVKLDIPELKFPIIVRLDFTHIKNLNAVTSALRTDFPIVILPLIYHFSLQNILREKFLALTERDKGRDLFDIIFLLRAKVEVNPKDINKKILEKIKNFPQAKLESDLRQFLPESLRKIIPILKEELLKELELQVH